MFSNGDFIVSAELAGGAIPASDPRYSLSINDFIFKIDIQTGVILWLKVYKNIAYNLDFKVFSIAIQSDIVFTASTKDLNKEGFALITKLTPDGSIIESFAVFDPNSSNKMILVSMVVLSDNSFILSTVTAIGVDGGLGVSENSFTDVTFIKVDSNRDINWITSYDFESEADDTILYSLHFKI